MAKLLILVFLVVPLVDFWILVSLGARIGFWPTVALAVGSAFLGVVLAKREGRRVLGSWRDAVTRGQIPDEGMTSGILVLVGAAMLAAPGFLTDVMGLSLLFPPTRRQIAAAVRRRMERRFAAAGGLSGVAARSAGGGAAWSLQMVEIGDPFGRAPGGEDAGGAEQIGWPRGEVIDVEAEVVESTEAPSRVEPARLLP